MKDRIDYVKFIERLQMSDDSTRSEATSKRHNKQFRTARENLEHLVDDGSFLAEPTDIELIRQDFGYDEQKESDVNLPPPSLMSLTPVFATEDEEDAVFKVFWELRMVKVS